jgi:tRNA(His) 5'-end guanylyltransferase
LITDFDDLKTDAWFGYETSKMNSIAAGLASAKFNQLLRERLPEVKGLPVFDCRAFNLPESEVVNCFRWRYQDWLRNSIQMLAQAHFSHKELHGKNKAMMHEMLFTEKEINWNDLDTLWKNGTLIYKDENRKFIKDTDIKFVEDNSFLGFVNDLMHPVKED